MPRLCSLVTLLGCFSALRGQDAAAPLPTGAPEFLAQVQRSELSTHTHWLADDARAGRYTGSQGQQQAVDYISKHFRALGLTPLGDKRGFTQGYPVTRISLDKATSLQFGGKKLERGFAVLHSSGTDQVSLSGKFVFCGNGSNDALPNALAHKIPVVAWTGAGVGGAGPGNDLQAVQRFVTLAQALAGRGATAAVVCLLADGGNFANTLNYKGLLADHSQLRYGNSGSELGMRVPLLVLNAEQSRALLEHLGVDAEAATSKPADQPASGKLSIVVKTLAKASVCNVVAVLPGTSKKQEAIVISAHHDHIGQRLDGDAFNGADDNASGTAGLLTIATALARATTRPLRSVIFLSVSGEELGLWGSHWFSENPTWPLERIVADLNIDMIGRPKTTAGKLEMQITPSFQHDKFSSLARTGAQLGAQFGLTFVSGDTYYQRSDHYNFARKGVPVVFFCDGEHPDYHQVSDTADRLDYAAMEAIARTAAWTAWQAANDAKRPQELGKQPSW